MMPWPMKGMLKITLLNQIRDADHHPPVMVPFAHSNPIGQMKQIGYVNRFISHENFYKHTEACQFLRFNGILLHVDCYSSIIDHD